MPSSGFGIIVCQRCEVFLQLLNKALNSNGRWVEGFLQAGELIQKYSRSRSWSVPIPLSRLVSGNPHYWFLLVYLVFGISLLWELVCSTVSCTYDSEDSILVKLVVLCSCERRRTHVSLHRVVGVNSPWYQVVVLTVWPYSPLTLAVQWVVLSGASIKTVWYYLAGDIMTVLLGSWLSPSRKIYRSYIPRKKD